MVSVQIEVDARIQFQPPDGDIVYGSRQPRGCSQVFYKYKPCTNA